MGTFSNINKFIIFLKCDFQLIYIHILEECYRLEKKVISNYFTQPPQAKMLKKFTPPIKDK